MCSSMLGFRGMGWGASMEQEQDRPRGKKGLLSHPEVAMRAGALAWSA